MEDITIIFIYTHNCGASPCRMVLDVERYLSLLDETSPEYSAQPSVHFVAYPFQSLSPGL